MEERERIVKGVQQLPGDWRNRRQRCCGSKLLLTTAGDGPAVSVASSGARILERFAFLRDEFPPVSAGRKRQLQHAECFQIAHFAIGMSHRKRTKILATGPDNELS